MKQVGYCYFTEQGLVGDPGPFYDYIVASNGLFIRAQNPLIRATVELAPHTVRGLASMRESLEFTYGKLPQHILNRALSVLIEDRFRERYVAVVFEDGYHIRLPTQEGTGGSVTYESVANTIVEFHSHAMMNAFFSGTDNSDEQGFKVYIVVGNLDRLIPIVLLRLGVYGYFAPLELAQVFNV